MIILRIRWWRPFSSRDVHMLCSRTSVQLGSCSTRAWNSAWNLYPKKRDLTWDHFSPRQALTYRIVKVFGVCLCVLFQVIYLQQAELNRETVYPMHPSSIHGVEDMSTLAELHEAAIMHNLFLRYQKDNIYVSHSLSVSTVTTHHQYVRTWMCSTGRLRFQRTTRQKASTSIYGVTVFWCNQQVVSCFEWRAWPTFTLSRFLQCTYELHGWIKQVFRACRRALRNKTSINFKRSTRGRLKIKFSYQKCEEVKNATYKIQVTAWMSVKSWIFTLRTRDYSNVVVSLPGFARALKH